MPKIFFLWYFKYHHLVDTRGFKSMLIPTNDELSIQRNESHQIIKWFQNGRSKEFKCFFIINKNSEIIYFSIQKPIKTGLFHLLESNPGKTFYIFTFSWQSENEAFRCWFNVNTGTSTTRNIFFNVLLFAFKSIQAEYKSQHLTRLNDSQLSALKLLSEEDEVPHLPCSPLSNGFHRHRCRSSSHQERGQIDISKILC